MGHSERVVAGKLLEKEIDSLGLFSDGIDLITLNQTSAMIGRRALREEMKKRTVITHSAGIMRLSGALQIVAINPPEKVGFVELLKRAQKITKDPITKEEGAHKTGFTDLAGAGVELMRSPGTTFKTMNMISSGYSAVDQLILRADDFPAGRAIVHSERDTFGFSDLANMDLAALNGISTFMISGHYHNDVLLAPNKTLELLTPELFTR